VLRAAAPDGAGAVPRPGKTADGGPALSDAHAAVLLLADRVVRSIGVALFR